MAVKRLRVFAGPNGSGKTTIVNQLRNEISFGVYVNADDIERELREKGGISFNDYHLNISQNSIADFFRKSTFSPVMRGEPDLWSNLIILDNRLKVSCTLDSYLAADIAEFIRQQLLVNGMSLTYETVMSHPNKLDFLVSAKNLGYRVYLYYIATEDPDINVNRVSIRVTQKGHNVSNKKVKDRYYKSLQQLKGAIKLSNRAYLWDNSGQAALFFAEITEGVDVSTFDEVPGWFIKNVVEKDSDLI